MYKKKKEPDRVKNMSCMSNKVSVTSLMLLSCNLIMSSSVPGINNPLTSPVPEMPSDFPVRWFRHWNWLRALPNWLAPYKCFDYVDYITLHRVCVWLLGELSEVKVWNWADYAFGLPRRNLSWSLESCDCRTFVRLCTVSRNPSARDCKSGQRGSISWNS